MSPPSQTRTQTLQLAAFVLLVTGCLGVIHRENKRIRDRELTLSAEGGDERVRRALEKLASDSTRRLGMTIGSGPVTERPVRHLYAQLIAAPEVMALGQSDADHMSATFFRDGARFYNGFVSNSFFAYQYEVFEEIAAAHGVPKLVLFDVSSGYLLQEGPEPAYDTKKDDPVWWAGPPYALGAPAPQPWYREVDSLLSLDQTELTVRWHVGRWRARDAAVQADVDTGEPYKLIPVTIASGVHRWLADGSRCYANERDGVLVPRGQPRVEIARGDRRLNEVRLAALAGYLDRLKRSGTTVIVYAPPLQPRVFEDAAQAPIVATYDQRMRALTTQKGLDFCNFTTQAAAIGCVAGDFYDELHISRHCDARVVRAIVSSGCAPLAGKSLEEKLAPAVLAGP